MCADLPALSLAGEPFATPAARLRAHVKLDMPAAPAREPSSAPPMQGMDMAKPAVAGSGVGSLGTGAMQGGKPPSDARASHDYADGYKLFWRAGWRPDHRHCRAVSQVGRSSLRTSAVIPARDANVPRAKPVRSINCIGAVIGELNDGVVGLAGT